MLSSISGGRRTIKRFKNLLVSSSWRLAEIRMSPSNNVQGVVTRNRRRACVVATASRAPACYAPATCGEHVLLAIYTGFRYN